MCHILLTYVQECIERVIEGDFLFGDVQVKHGKIELDLQCSILAICIADTVFVLQTTLCLRLAGVAFNETALTFNTLMMNHPPGLPDYDRGDDWENKQRGIAVQWPQQHPCAKVQSPDVEPMVLVAAAASVPP